ncbi:hypothetical protein [Bradyrhizobium sp. I1.7.5]|uniref:hypothetical protein n=1 Tax=Bradyrhizobium sp. I1.7.5 TaxID=3156363 RepID=UPI00339226F3
MQKKTLLAVLSGLSTKILKGLNATLTIRLAYHDVVGGEGSIVLSARDAAALANECAGEDRAVGSRVRYRVMPDDSLEFRLLVASQADAA